MVDTIQTKEGAVAISQDAVRSSMRSMRRGKTKNIPTPTALASHLRANGRKLGEGIAEIYEQLEKESPTFFAFFSPENKGKNKFPKDVFLADKTRVVLDEEPDYYHASFVDGCTQAKQYILAQAPFSEETAAAFYRLVVKCKPKIIIVLMELDQDDDGQFILPPTAAPKKYGKITVKNDRRQKSSSSKSSKSKERTDKTDKFTTYILSVTYETEKGEKFVQKFQLLTFNTWTEDNAIPTEDFMKLHAVVHKKLDEKPCECSQLVVCPTGAYRSGVWAVFDTEAERLKTKNRIRFSDTVRNVRNQRYSAIETFELFDGLLNLLVAYAKAKV